MTTQNADLAGHVLHIPPRPVDTVTETRDLARRGITRRVTNPDDRAAVLAMLGLDERPTVAPGLCGCGCGKPLGPVDIAKGGGVRIRCRGRGAA